MLKKISTAEEFSKILKQNKEKFITILYLKNDRFIEEFEY
jgi:hypothetical protein